MFEEVFRNMDSRPTAAPTAGRGRVAEEVDGDHGKENRQTRQDGQYRGGLFVGVGIPENRFDPEFCVVVTM